MSSYGTLGNEEDGLILQERTWREKLGEKLETQNFHIAVLGLVAIDMICAVVQIVYTFFHECQAPLITSSSKEGLLFIAFEMAEVIGISIVFLFLVECILCLIAFGPRYYLPGWPHWRLHVFDAFGNIFIYIESSN